MLWGPSWTHFALPAAFVVALGWFLCVLGRSGLDFGGAWDALGRALELSEVHFWRGFRARTLAMRKTSECIKTTVFLRVSLCSRNFARVTRRPKN